MKGNFFEQFKLYLLNEKKERIHEFIPYYETVLQAKDKIKELCEDCQNYYLEIEYNEDETEGYTQGNFRFHLYEKDPNSDYGWHSKLSHYYKLSLSYDERMWGYCECTPDDSGYNPLHDCCGNGCDWSAPSISLVKIESIAYHNFDGVESNLWKLEEKWQEEKIDYEEEKRKAHLERIEREIKLLEEEKQKYILK